MAIPVRQNEAVRRLQQTFAFGGAVIFLALIVARVYEGHMALTVLVATVLVAIALWKVFRMSGRGAPWSDQDHERFEIHSRR